METALTFYMVYQCCTEALRRLRAAHTLSTYVRVREKIRLVMCKEVPMYPPMFENSNLLQIQR
jgi:hypothetical protein